LYLCLYLRLLEACGKGRQCQRFQLNFQGSDTLNFAAKSSN
jgi:hypothetical protein